MAAAKPTTQSPLTAKLIASLKPGAPELGDPACRGLRLRVTTSNAKVFRWTVVEEGRFRVITIGRWSLKERPGHVTLHQARAWLERLKEAHREGHLAEVEGELEATRPTRAAADAPALEGELTVDDVAKDFREFIARRRKNPGEVDRTLDHDILPAIGKRPIRAVTTREVRQLVEAVVERGAATTAGRVLAHVRQLFRFAQGRDDVQSNPADPLDPEALGVVDRVCDRHLSPAEIGEFWRALDKSGATPTVRACLRLLLLLGVRSGELLRATWDEVDLEAATWTIPVSHQKVTLRGEAHARPWAVPLPPAAQALFRELKVFADSLRSDYVAASFVAEVPPADKEPAEERKGPRGKPLSEKALIHAMRKLFEGEEPLLKFAGERPTPHDLRRTVRTGLGDLGIEHHVAERALGHSLGRIAATYDRSDYLPQRRAALEKWSVFVERLVAPEASKVAFLPAPARA